MKSEFKEIYNFINDERQNIIDKLNTKNKIKQRLIKYNKNSDLLNTLFLNKLFSFIDPKSEKKVFAKELIDDLYNANVSYEDIQGILCEVKDTVTVHALNKELPYKTLKKLYKLQSRIFKYILHNFFKKIEIRNKIIEKQMHIIEEHVLLSITDKEGRITNATDAFCKLMGYKKSELIGKNHKIFKAPNSSDEFFKDMWETILSGKEWRAEVHNKTKENKIVISKTRIIPILDNNGDIVQFMAIRDDITANEESKYDGLTKLYNRKQFDTRFQKIIEEAKLNNDELNLILLDADDFKYVNDKHGHKKGDEVLVKISQIINDNTRKSDLCARWGGEEFVIALPNSKIEIAEKIAGRIKEHISLNIAFEDKKQTCSFGITSLKYDDTPCSIFERADKALYQAKNKGKNRIEVC